MNGTPKSLNEAIANGFDDRASDVSILATVEKHVIDFLAQKFATHELEFSGQETATLWKAITGREYGKLDLREHDNDIEKAVELEILFKAAIEINAQLARFVYRSQLSNAEAAERSVTQARALIEAFKKKNSS